MSAHILVVEDEPSIADNIVYALTTEGFVAHWCATGQEALDLLAREQISLIILDVGLPDINGFDLVREIRRSSMVPVIFVTARADEVDRIVGLELGADDYLVKPFSPRELTARVRAVLRRTEAKPIELKQVASANSTESLAADSSSYGPFQIDEIRHRISYHERTLELSRYEFRLLAALIGNPGRVFTREQLMLRVWEEPEMSSERTVDTHVKTLRQKLKAIYQAEDPIMTHRGIGYSLKELS